MDIDQLKTFASIVELKSYSKTALYLHISQPTVSTRMKALEDEVGQKLLYRHGKEIQLTPAGEYFYGHAQKMINTSEEAMKNLREFSSDFEFTVGVTPLCSRYFLMDIIPSLKEHPNYIPMNIRTVSQPYQLIELFFKGMIDIAILSAYNYPKSQNVELLWKEPTVLVVNPNHPLTKKGTLEPSDLSVNSLALLGTDVNHYSHQLIQMCKEENIYIKPEVATDSFEIAKNLVKKGNLISFLPLICVEEEIKTGELVEIRYNLPRELSFNVYLFYRMDTHHEFFSAFYSLLKEIAFKRQINLR